MSRLLSRAAGAGLALALLALPACKKGEPDAASPAAGPKVIVEEPGEEPGEGGARAGEGGADEGDETIGRTELVVSDVPCKSDADCREATCCHATSCTSVADAPSCAGVMCTADCQGGTMDCNGGCLCQEGRCAARLWWAPEPEG